MTNLEEKRNLRFPLPIFLLDIAPLPGECIPLRVFEPRYLNLVDASIEREDQWNRCFGVISPHEQSPGSIGTMLRIDEVGEVEGSEQLLIVCSAESRFTIDQGIENEEYPAALVVPYEDQSLDVARGARILDVTQKTQLYAKRLSSPRSLLIPTNFDNSFEIAACLDLGLSERKALLKMRSEEERLERVDALLDFLIAEASSGLSADSYQRVH